MESSANLGSNPGAAFFFTIMYNRFEFHDHKSDGEFLRNSTDAGCAIRRGGVVRVDQDKFSLRLLGVQS